MSAFRNWAYSALIVLLTLASALIVPGALRAGTEDSSSGLTHLMVQRAQAEVDRLRPLVADGTLPQTRLTEAQAQVDDAIDAEILSQTLYSSARVQDMSAADASRMVHAARRRVDRESKLVEERQGLLSMGILARSDVAGLESELEDRRRVFRLAESRVQLLDELKRMAALEAQMEEASRVARSKAALLTIRYQGSGRFDLHEIPLIARQFELKFHRELPVSAYGQTATHASLGLDHRGRVDVALSPDSPEGVWVRQLLEHMRIPYLAFRSALAGAATGPHIHIGTGSTRLGTTGNGLNFFGS
jgi:hypothetical protein